MLVFYDEPYGNSISDETLYDRSAPIRDIISGEANTFEVSVGGGVQRKFWIVKTWVKLGW